MDFSPNRSSYIDCTDLHWFVWLSHFIPMTENIFNKAHLDTLLSIYHSVAIIFDPDIGVIILECRFINDY